MTEQNIVDVVARLEKRLHDLDHMLAGYGPNIAARVSALEAVNAGEPKRVVFEAAHGIVERIQKLEAQNAAFQNALMLKSEEADKQDRVDATYNAYVQGSLAREWMRDEELHEDARKYAAHAHGLDVPKPQAQQPEYVPSGLTSGLNSVTTEHVLEKRETAKSRAQAFQRTPTAVDAYFAASSRLSLAAANIGESWGAGGSEDHPGSQMHELLAAAEAFAYDSSEALQPRAADEWNTFKSIVAQLALGDLASGPEWLMALRDQAKAAVGGR